MCLLPQPELWRGKCEVWVSCADPCLAWAFLPTAEFCLLQGKHGGFEHEKKVDSVYLDPLAYREFAFLDMPDGGQEISSQDGPLHVLKQGIYCLHVVMVRWRSGPSLPRGDVTFRILLDLREGQVSRAVLENGGRP